jgi:hypothetical protein
MALRPEPGRMPGLAAAAMTLDMYADPFDDDLEAVARGSRVVTRHWMQCCTGGHTWRMISVVLAVIDRKGSDC